MQYGLHAVFSYILYSWIIIIIEALTYTQHANVVAH